MVVYIIVATLVILVISSFARRSGVHSVESEYLHWSPARLSLKKRGIDFSQRRDVPHKYVIGGRILSKEI